METTLCPECDGTRRVPHGGYPGSYKCVYCDGSGVRKRRGHGGYKTKAGAEKALRERTGVHCSSCSGTGQCVYPELTDCHVCNNGVLVTSIQPGDVVPDVLDLFSYVPRPAMAELAKELTFEVHRTGVNMQLSWGVSHLGLGTIYACTDYGRSFEATDEAVIRDVREHLSGAEQYVKIVNRETRTVTGKILILVTTNGYAVTAEGVKH